MRPFFSFMMEGSWLRVPRK